MNINAIFCWFLLLYSIENIFISDACLKIYWIIFNYGHVDCYCEYKFMFINMYSYNPDYFMDTIFKKC